MYMILKVIDEDHVGAQVNMNVRSNVFYSIKSAAICDSHFPQLAQHSFLFSRHWLVHPQPHSLVMLAHRSNNPQPTQFIRPPFAFTPTQISSVILCMPSYKNLAIIALAASFVSPAQSALNR